MHKLPPEVVPHADQARAHADNVLAQMVTALRVDLATGVDPMFAWWSMSRTFAGSGAPAVAPGFASALLRLASSVPRAVPPPPVKHRGRVQKVGHRRWSMTCLTCGVTFPTTSQSDAYFLSLYHWRACD